MKTKMVMIAAAAGLLIGSTALLQAQKGGGMNSSPGASSSAPGQEMKQPGGTEERREGPGASGFSPGHQMQEGEGKGRPGASSSAPGHNSGTTGAGDRDRDDKMTGDDKAARDSDRRGIDKR
jgi:hypothetical protein